MTSEEGSMQVEFKTKKLENANWNWTKRFKSKLKRRRLCPSTTSSTNGKLKFPIGVQFYKVLIITFWKCCILVTKELKEKTKKKSWNNAKKWFVSFKREKLRKETRLKRILTSSAPTLTFSKTHIDWQIFQEAAPKKSETFSMKFWKMFLLVQTSWFLNQQ